MFHDRVFLTLFLLFSACMHHKLILGLVVQFYIGIVPTLSQMLSDACRLGGVAPNDIHASSQQQITPYSVELRTQLSTGKPCGEFGVVCACLVL